MAVCRSDAIVPPLQPARNHYPVIAVTEGEALLERTGERRPFTPDILLEEQWYPSIWISNGIDHLFYLLHERFKKDRYWTWRLQESSPPRGDCGPVNTSIIHFGFRRKSHSRGPGSASRTSRIHYPFDGSAFCDPDSEGHISGADRLERLYQVGITVRDLIDEMGIRPRFNPAGVAAQLLRHPQFYPQSRKRVPEWINETAREYLPGNHYDLFTDRGVRIKAAGYADQKSAHHFAARTVPLPSSDTLEGRGFTRGDRTWLTRGSRRFSEELRRFGLFKVTVRVPHLSADEYRFLPPEFARPGTYRAVVWSSELPYIEEMGVTVLALHWSLGSTEQDTGLPAYAEWAERTGEAHPELKHMLLAAYGILAVRSRDTESLVPDRYARKRGTFLGPHFIPGRRVGLHTFSGGPCANVLQRGLIEAFTRRLSLAMARACERDALLGIYGDAVLAKHLPGEQLAAPWRTKGILHDLTFDTATRFESRELTRLPGTPRFLRNLVRIA